MRLCGLVGPVAAVRPPGSREGVGSLCLSCQAGTTSRSWAASEENEIPALSSGGTAPFPVPTRCRAWAVVCSLGLRSYS